jgi:hypothetical protein
MTKSMSYMYGRCHQSVSLKKSLECAYWIYKLSYEEKLLLNFTEKSFDVIAEFLKNMGWYLFDLHY